MPAVHTPSAQHTKRLGILGGTFDPPHLGHLILAETAADTLQLDLVLFAPAANPPHKAPVDIRTSADHRVAMVERAIAGNPRFTLSRTDLDRPGPHYTADLLAILQQQWPGTHLILLIGADSLRDLPTWSRPEEVIARATLGVMARPGARPDLTALTEAIPGITDAVAWIDAPLVEIASSTLVRDLQAGRSIRYRTSDAVLDYIQTHALYRNEP